MQACVTLHTKIKGTLQVRSTKTATTVSQHSMKRRLGACKVGESAAKA
jgi:hypothetical protein